MTRAPSTACLIALLVGSSVACVKVAPPEAATDARGGRIEQLRAGCDGGQVPRERAAACLSLAGFYEHGSFGLKRDSVRAALLWEEAASVLAASCENGDAQDCTRAASVLGMGIRDGGGDAETREMGAWIERYADDGCRGGDPVGCALLGAIYERGRGVPRDPARAIAQYDKACSGGYAPSCLTLAAFREGDTAASASAYRRACDAGSGFGCAAAAQRYRRGVGVRLDPEQAGHLFARGCALGDPAACVLGAEMFAQGTAADRRRAAVLASAGCAQDIAPACLLLGEAYEAAGDRGEALELYRKACEAGEDKACSAAWRLRRAPRRYDGDDGG